MGGSIKESPEVEEGVEELVHGSVEDPVPRAEEFTPGEEEGFKPGADPRAEEFTPRVAEFSPGAEEEFTPGVEEEFMPGAVEADSVEVESGGSGHVASLHSSGQYSLIF